MRSELAALKKRSWVNGYIYEHVALYDYPYD